MTLRDVADMVFTAARRPEETGCKFNDRLATTLVTGLCKPDATFIDVGAHIGSIVAAVIHMTRSQEDGLGYSKADMHQWFSAHSYELLAPDRMAHFGPGLSLDGFLDSHWYPRRTTNYFGVPTERREEVRGRVRRLLKLEPSER